MKIFVVIPTFNELGNIKFLVKDILKLRIKDLDIVIVDDNSPDGTGKLADKLARKYSKVHVLHRSGKLGLGTAYVAGWNYALAKGAQILVTMDADFFHNPKYLSELINRLDFSKYDISIGSRHVVGGRIIGFSLARHLISAAAQFICMRALGLKTYDSTSGFRAYKREVITKIKPESIKSQGYSFLIEALYRANEMGFKSIEIPVTAPARKKGKSKISKGEILKAVLTVFRLRFTRQNLM